MEAMTKHRSHSAAFKRQVAEEFIAGETLHALSKRHDISRQLIRIWVRKFEAGALDDDVQAADLLQEYEAKIAALEKSLTTLVDMMEKMPPDVDRATQDTADAKQFLEQIEAAYADAGGTAQDRAQRA